MFSSIGRFRSTFLAIRALVIVEPCPPNGAGVSLDWISGEAVLGERWPIHYLIAEDAIMLKLFRSKPPAALSV